MSLRISGPAEADLEDIWISGAARWGVRQAQAYSNAIFDVFDLLAEFPMLGTSRPDIAAGLRLMVVRRHLMFYRVIEDEVVVVRILHHNMDPLRHLRET